MLDNSACLVYNNDTLVALHALSYDKEDPMPRKFLFTKEQIVDTALSLVRKRGISALTARSLADALGTSTKPIFGLFRNMDEVHDAVMYAASDLYHERIRTDMARGEFPPYKASGMAYIRFACEERELFRMLFMRDRSEECADAERDRAENEPFVRIIAQNLGLSVEEAYRFHLEMWVFVHGIASMIVTGYLVWDDTAVSDALTDAYMGLRNRFREIAEERK